MKKHTYSLPTKGVTWMLAMTMALSSIPSMPTFAEEVTDEYTSEALPEEDLSSVFIITKFPEYKKADDNTFADKDFDALYGNLKAKPGTEQKDLGLPDSITVTGYLESEGPELASDWELTELKWKLKMDEYKEYSTNLPAGSYTFVPNLDRYTQPDSQTGDVLFDEIRLAEEVKLPKLTVTLEEEQTEPITEAPTEPITEVITEAPIEPATEVITEASTEPTTEVITEAPTEPITEVITETPTEPITEAITEFMTEVITIPEETQAPTEPTTEPIDVPEDGTIIIDTTTTEATTEPVTEAITEAPTEPITEVITEAPTEAATEVITEAPTEPATEAITEAPQVVNDLSVTLTLQDWSGLTEELISYPEKITVKASPAEGENTLIFEAPCYYPLSTLSLIFTDTETNESLLVEPAGALNFSDGTAKTLTLTNALGNTYQFTLTLKNKAHDLSAATCQNAPVCKICGQTIGNIIPHNYSIPATCTKKATCSMCGQEDPNGTYADHKPNHPATCKEDSICTVCKEILEPALGHKWKAATCTEPKTCSRCGATKGKALGHDMQDDWLIESESTDSKHGEEIRYCNREDCDYTETRPRNIIGSADKNSISGIEANKNYDLKTVLKFTANGSGMANTKPIDGDIRFVPTSWKVQNTPGEFKDNFSGAFSVSIAGSYTLTVNFQKQLYQGGWKNTDSIDSKSITFTAGKVIQGTPVNGSEDGIRINPQTGDTTVILPLVILFVVALLVIVLVLVYKRKRR